jgi:pantoate--beta-alanine ligase
MIIIHTIEKMREWSDTQIKQGRSIGLVPTMGHLHAGHMSLVKKSLETCAATVTSIFVNPLQFGENEDFDTYPVNLESDEEMLRSTGVDVLFIPTRSALYPEGYKTFVHVEGITEYLCGKSRPGFFRGVATIVLKLFNIVKPQYAFFGEKDWQQLAVIESLVRDLNLDLEIVRGPLVRESDGLAMSSRNHYLTKSDRKAARSLSASLNEAREQIKNGELSAEKIQSGIRRRIEQHANTRIDYISLCDPVSFQECATIGNSTLIALAVHVGKARLIDNCLVRRD